MRIKLGQDKVSAGHVESTSDKNAQDIQKATENFPQPLICLVILSIVSII